MRLDALDTYGRPANSVYSFGKLLLDQNFEKRLKLFDPNLKLVFDNSTQRWTILEWRLDGAGWNILLRAQDEQGNEKPLGEWVFNKLYVWRKQADERDRLGADAWSEKLAYEAERKKQSELASISREMRGRIVDNINQFRRAHKAENNEPVSDVTAGYPKIQRRKNVHIQSHV